MIKTDIMQSHYLILIFLYTLSASYPVACLFLELEGILIASFSSTIPIGVLPLFLTQVSGSRSRLKRSLWPNPSCPPVLSFCRTAHGYSREHGAAASGATSAGETPPPLLAARLVPPQTSWILHWVPYLSLSPTPLVLGALLQMAIHLWSWNYKLASLRGDLVSWSAITDSH